MYNASMTRSGDADTAQHSGRMIWPATAAEILPVVYSELRTIAEHRLRTLAPGASLNATDLLHEAYMRLARVPDPTFESKRHFIGAAALAMRSVIVDRARAKSAAKRGGRDPVQHFDADVISSDRPPEEILSLDAAIAKLEAVDPRSAQVVLLRFYLGMTEVQISQALGLTDRTVRRDWAFAKAWLSRELVSDNKGFPGHE